MAESSEGFLSSFLQKTIGFLDYDCRGVGITGEDGSVYINVPTPAWYPDSFVRSLKNSLYLKMVNNTTYLNSDGKDESTKLEFYKESSGSAIVKALTSAVKSIVTVGVNQVASVVSKAQGVYDSVSSLFKTTDDSKKGLSASIIENQKIPFLAAQPYIVVRGIHVTENIKASVEILQSALSATGSAFGNLKDMFTNGESFTKLFDEGNKKLQEAFKSTFGIKEGSDWASIFTNGVFSPKFRHHSIAEQMMRQSLCGKYTMMCKIPLLNNDGVLIKSSGQDGFKRGTVGYELKDTKGVGEKLAQELTGDLNIGLSDTIKWIFNVNSDSMHIKPIDTRFTIYNDTFEHFLLNYAFIYGFMATTKATTDGVLVRAPYVYDVTIPGGMRYMLCSCDASVKCVGNMRKISDDAESLGNAFNGKFNVPINGSILEYIPDAYEVHVSFKSLIPDLWNFIESYISMNTESNDKSIAIGTKISSTLATFAKHLSEGK